MSSLNKEALIAAYSAGQSIPQVAERFGVSRSVTRYHLHRAGVLRSRAEGVRKAAKEGRLGAGLRGKRRSFSDDHKRNLSKARVRWANAGNAIGVSLKPNGYVEHTRGPHKGRYVHVALMEQRIGRPLRKDECVHHIDGDKKNNSIDNLMVMTSSEHARFHALENGLGRKKEGK